MIVIRKQVLLALGLLGLVTGLCAAGWAHTPFEDGRALLLTRDARAIQVYLTRARRWRDEIARQNATLQALFAAVPSEQGTSAFGAPDSGGHPTHLYARSEQARRAWDTLLSIQREMEATAVPPSLTSTHEQARQALGAALGLGERTLEYVGAPTAARSSQVVVQWELAQRTWKALDGALGE